MMMYLRAPPGAPRNSPSGCAASRATAAASMGAPAGSPINSERRPGRKTWSSSRGEPRASKPTTPRTMSVPGAFASAELFDLLRVETPELHLALMGSARNDGLAHSAAGQRDRRRPGLAAGYSGGKPPGLAETKMGFLRRGGRENMGCRREDDRPRAGGEAFRPEGAEKAGLSPAPHGRDQQSGSQANRPE